MDCFSRCFAHIAATHYVQLCTCDGHVYHSRRRQMGSMNRIANGLHSDRIATCAKSINEATTYIAICSIYIYYRCSRLCQARGESLRSTFEKAGTSFNHGVCQSTHLSKNFNDALSTN